MWFREFQVAKHILKYLKYYNLTQPEYHKYFIQARIWIVMADRISDKNHLKQIFKILLLEN